MGLENLFLPKKMLLNLIPGLVEQFLEEGRKPVQATLIRLAETEKMGPPLVKLVGCRQDTPLLLGRERFPSPVMPAVGKRFDSLKDRWIDKWEKKPFQLKGIWFKPLLAQTAEHPIINVKGIVSGIVDKPVRCRSKVEQVATPVACAILE